MVVFELSVNGETRFIGDDVRAITLVADRSARHNAERVAVHVGVGEPGERQIQYFGADLRPGDEISIRVLEDEEANAASQPPESCSFCARDVHEVRSLAAGQQAAICESCLYGFEAVIAENAPLPLGTSIEDGGDGKCGFCLKGPPEVAGLFVRNGAALCPACLRTFVDLIRGKRE